MDASRRRLLAYASPRRFSGLARPQLAPSLLDTSANSPRRRLCGPESGFRFAPLAGQSIRFTRALTDIGRCRTLDQLGAGSQLGVSFRASP